MLAAILIAAIAALALPLAAAFLQLSLVYDTMH
jgi:hypothetical protein